MFKYFKSCSLKLQSPGFTSGWVRLISGIVLVLLFVLWSLDDKKSFYKYLESELTLAQIGSFFLTNNEEIFSKLANKYIPDQNRQTSHLSHLDLYAENSIAHTSYATALINFPWTKVIGNQELGFDQSSNIDHVRRVYLTGLIKLIVLILIVGVIVYRKYNLLSKAQKEIVDKNQAISMKLQELERANKNYLRIMRIMAHDIVNPLSGMAGLAATLLDDSEMNEESKRIVELIEKTGMHSIEMIQELLKTGLANDDASIDLQKLDLNALLYDSVELLQFKAREKNQTIILQEENLDFPVFALVNYEKIWRVLNNLIVNAIKFSFIGGIIKTGIKEYKTSIVIYVEDEGIGVPEKDKETRFDMFSEAKKVGTNGELPFGLGLSISKKIMEKHGGKIWFEKGEKGGTIFFLEFPKH